MGTAPFSVHDVQQTPSLQLEHGEFEELYEGITQTFAGKLHGVHALAE